MRQQHQPSTNNSEDSDSENPPDDSHASDEAESATEDDSDDISEDKSGNAVGDEDEDSDDGDSEKFDTVDVNFEFFDPQEKDFHGIKTLLNSYLDGEEYNCSELVDLIINQASVGTVIKGGEDDDPLAVCSVINTCKQGNVTALQQILAYLEKNCCSEDVRSKLSQAWASKGTGLIVNTRLMNCPAQLGPPLQTAVFSEINNAQKEEDSTQEERDSFSFERYILYDRVYCPVTPGEEPSSSQQPKKKHKKQKQSGVAPDELVYLLPETEFYHKHCSWSFVFRTTDRRGGDEDLAPHRVVGLITHDKGEAARAELDAAIGNAMLQDQQQL